MQYTTEFSIRDLIRRFETDTVYEGKGFARSFAESAARRELVERAEEALDPIIRHMKESLPSDIWELNSSWGSLLCEIEMKIDPPKGVAQTPRDTAGWIAWGEKMIFTLAAPKNKSIKQQ